MGIKGIYGEIGNGQRVSLAKLAAESITTDGRPLRVAVDISIWLFQIQASEGGASPAIRTLYFRLVRLLGHGIQPLFVFDGPNKPPFKRGAPTSSAQVSFTRPAKRLIDLFGFQHHTAPGEAEAECAKLQKLGVVDLVLSEDVDTLAFGCTKTIRSWSAEGSGSKIPTHVSLHEIDKISSGSSGLDREGMILVALMNGGDYLPAGIPGCGIKLACEAARAGFGHDLCELSPDNEAGFTAWKERLRYELNTNESGFFRTKHKALKIPEDFPDISVLGYHAHPVVSSLNEIDDVRHNLASETSIDVKGLRDFVDEEFNWKYLSGAKKFLRQLAPSLLAHKLRLQAPFCDGTTGLDEQTEREERLVLSIIARRNHFSVDGISQIKVTFIPAHIAGLDLDQEPLPDEHENRTDSDQEQGREDEDENERPERSPVRKNVIADWDPWAPEKTWILEAIIRLGAPLSLERWDAYIKNGQATDIKGRSKPKTTRGGMKSGAMNSYLRVAKPNPLTISQQKALFKETYGDYSNFEGDLNHQVKPNDSRPEATRSTISQASTSSGRTGKKPSRKRSELQARSSTKPSTMPGNRNVNPWTIAQQSRSGTDKTFSTPNKSNTFVSPKPITSSMYVNNHNLSDGNVGMSQSRAYVRESGTSSFVTTTHLNTVMRKSLEGTWKGTDDHLDPSLTPERLITDVSLVDMTNDQEM